MNHTDNSNDPDAKLPQFSVRVAPLAKIENLHLRRLVDRFRKGDAEPFFFGDNAQAEAAVIPFAKFVQLLQADHELAAIKRRNANQGISDALADHDDPATRDEGDASTLDDVIERLDDRQRNRLKRLIEDDDNV
jgi:hypothetical protein